MCVMFADGRKPVSARVFISGPQWYVVSLSNARTPLADLFPHPAGKKASNRSLIYREPDPRPFKSSDVAAVVVRANAAQDRYSFNVNQVESDFMPFRSILAPSHTAKAIGTDIPALNWTSFASPFSKVRFTTTRHVGPV